MYEDGSSQRNRNFMKCKRKMRVIIGMVNNSGYYIPQQKNAHAPSLAENIDHMGITDHLNLAGSAHFVNIVENGPRVTGC